MFTLLEEEIYKAKRHCELSLISLRGLRLGRIFAGSDHRYFTDQLQLILKDIHAISTQAISVKNTLAELDDIRRLLLETGASNLNRPGTNAMIEVNSREYVITSQLLEVTRRKDERVYALGRRMEQYNADLQILYEEREARIVGTFIMNIMGFPRVSALPQMLEIELIDELYSPSHYFEYDKGAAQTPHTPQTYRN